MKRQTSFTCKIIKYYIVKNNNLYNFIGFQGCIILQMAAFMEHLSVTNLQKQYFSYNRGCIVKNHNGQTHQIVAS